MFSLCLSNSDRRRDSFDVKLSLLWTNWYRCALLGIKATQAVTFMDQIVFNSNVFFLSWILKIFRLYSACENYLLTALRHKQPFTCMVQFMAIELYKQLSGYLVVTVTMIKIKRMYFPLWWQMLEIATMLQFQV